MAVVPEAAVHLQAAHSARRTLLLLGHLNHMENCT